MKHLTFILIFLVLPSFAFADFIDLLQADKCETILEVFIGDENIIVKLEIGKEDYPWFSDVIPEAFYKGGYTDKEEKTRWNHFLQNKLILQSEGRNLAGHVKIVEQRDKIPVAGYEGSQAGAELISDKIIYVEIEYPLTSEINQLSITPPLTAGKKNTKASIGFIVYHKSIPVNDLKYLVKKETLHLNWEDPWYSYFENQNLARHHSSSLMSFLYVEPYEVRHEVLGRLKDLEDWIDFGYGMDDLIGIPEQEDIKQRIANFLETRNIVAIDGVRKKPILDQVHFVEATISGIQVIEIPKPIPYATAIIGVIFAYTDKGLPQEVTITWDMFNERIQQVPAMSLDPAGPWPYDLSPSENVLTWTNFLKHYKLPTIAEQKVVHQYIGIPLITLVLVLVMLVMLTRKHWNPNKFSRWGKFFFVLFLLLGVLTLPFRVQTAVPFSTKKSYSTPEAKELINQLLRNTYRAFDFREEGDIYDKLAISNDLQLVQDIYLQTRKSLVIENQGGVEAKVDEVLVTSIEEVPNSEGGLSYRCTWIVKGVVGHWGHKHQRVNQNEAIIKIKPIKGAWKIYELEMIEQVRL